MRYNIIDTISIYLKRADCIRWKNNWNFEHIEECLENYTTGTKSKTGEKFISGWYLNFKVYFNNDILIITGSLPKYYHTSNIKTLTYDDAIKAIESLTYDFKLPLERGYIKRLDVGRNIIVRRKVKCYLDTFDKSRGLYSDRTANRLLYKTYSRKTSMSLYDKKKEIQKNDRELAEYLEHGSLKNKNILRYELQMLEKVNQQLGYKALRVVMLRSKTFVKKINDVWYDGFKKLSTQKRFGFTHSISSFEEFKKQLLIYAINDIGFDNLLGILETLRQERKITSNQKMYSKNKLLQLLKSEGCLIELNHIEELNKEMNFLHSQLSSDEYDELENMILLRKSNRYKFDLPD